jgi:hypothetical protein
MAGVAQVGEATQGHEIVDWWMSGDGRWHQGTPPAGWTQSENRRWCPREPPSTAAGDASTSQSVAGPPAALDEDLEDWYDAREPSPGDWDGSGWYRDGEATDGIEDRGREWPSRARLAVAVAVLAAVTAALGFLAGSDGGRDSGSASPATTTSTSISPPSVSDGGGAALPAPQEAAMPSTTVRAGALPVSTPPRPSTTAAPPEPAPPPATHTPRDQPPGSFRQGGPCETVGATAVTANGTPVTCATAGCAGDPFDEPRWRPTACSSPAGA